MVPMLTSGCLGSALLVLLIFFTYNWKRIIEELMMEVNKFSAAV